MNVSLTPHLEALIRQKVETGLYNNASEVVREALRLMDERDRQQRFRAAVDVGVAQFERGETVPYTTGLLESIDKATAKKAREGREPNPDVVG